MWPFLTILALAAVGIHFWWRHKFLRQRRQVRAEMEELQRRQQQTTIDAKAQQQVLFNSMLEGCCCWTAIAGFTSPTARSKIFSA